MFFFGNQFGNGHKNALKEAKIDKGWAGLNIFYSLLSLVMGILKFKLPETMDARSFKLTLIQNGYAVISKIKKFKYSEDGDLMNLMPTDCNNMTPYGRILNMGCVDYSGKSYGRFTPYTPTNKTGNAVVVYWNEENVPPIYRILWYAKQLLTIQNQITVAIKNTKASVAIACEKEQVKVIEDNWAKADEGKPLFLDYNSSFGNKPELLINNLTAEVLKTLMETYDKTFSKFCNEFGINADAVINKMSGVSEKELSQNDESNSINLMNIINSVKEGLALASEKFGEEMTVEIAYERLYNVEEVKNNIGYDEEANNLID